MPTFLAERYWPGMTPAAAALATSSLVEATVGTDTALLETILAADDEVCLWYLEAASIDAVAAVFIAADVPRDRISVAARL